MMPRKRTGKTPAARGRLEPRRLPVQSRGRERTRQILDTTARLLEQVGIDDLTTILIADKLGISVGALYHYYPNKHAILHALGTRWLEEIASALDEIERQDLENFSLHEFLDLAVDRLLCVYKRQRAMLSLAQAFSSIPALRDLDEQHDCFVIQRLMAIFRRLGFSASGNELNRLGRTFHELTHALLLVIVNQHTIRASRTTADLKRMAFALLAPHRKEDLTATAVVEPP